MESEVGGYVTVPQSFILFRILSLAWLFLVLVVATAFCSRRFANNRDIGFCPNSSEHDARRYLLVGDMSTIGSEMLKIQSLAAKQRFLHHIVISQFFCAAGTWRRSYVLHFGLLRTSEPNYISVYNVGVDRFRNVVVIENSSIYPPYNDLIFLQKLERARRIERPTLTLAMASGGNLSLSPDFSLFP